MDSGRTGRRDEKWRAGGWAEETRNGKREDGHMKEEMDSGRTDRRKKKWIAVGRAEEWRNG